MELLDQLEAENPEDTNLAPKVWPHAAARGDMVPSEKGTGHWHIMTQLIHLFCRAW